MFFNIFNKKPLLNPATTEWLFETFAWAIENFGTYTFYQDTILVTPTHKHFPLKIEQLHEYEIALKTLEMVKKYAMIQNWPCELVVQEPDVELQLAETLIIESPTAGTAGTFSHSEGKYVITYNPKILKNSENMVATFAHELAHYLSYNSPLPPLGREYLEHATDLLAVYMGFGVFLANTAFSFQQYNNVYSQGWTVCNQGYLSQYELTYALAIFCTLKNISNPEVEKHLKKSLCSFYKKAVKEISDKSDIDRLKSINKGMKDVRLLSH